MTVCYFDYAKQSNITDVVTAISWETRRTGTPGKVSMTVLQDSEVAWNLGAVVTVAEEGDNLFFGYVFSITYSQDSTVEILAYDQMRYLKNKDTYVFTGQRADQMIAQICKDYGLEVGALPSTGYVIPTLVEDQSTLIDICLGALEETLQQTGNRYTLWDDYGTLQLSLVEKGDRVLLLGDSSLVTAYSHQQSLDEETYNRVVVSQMQNGERVKYIAQDSDNQGPWGLLQLSQSATTATNDPQGLADTLLSLYNQPSQTVTLQAIASPGLRAGEVVQVTIADADLETTCLVEQVTHDLYHKTMTLKVSVYPC